MNMKTTNDDLEDQTFDTETALAEISTDLFGQGGTDGEGVEGSDAEAKAAPGSETPVEKPSSQPKDKTEPDSSSPVADPAQSPDNAAEVQETGAPKTWTKEALAEWATVPPRAQQEILKREEDFLRGITMYKEGAEVGQRYSKVVEPYAPILAAEGIDPIQLFQSFAANHYLLSRGTEDQKLELAANMITGYGIDFNKLISFVGDRLIEPADPRIAQLEAKIDDLSSSVQSRQQQDQTAMTEQLAAEVDAFAQDPANLYFNELVEDIAKIFHTGQASTLKEAYDKAVYLNPVTRQKEIDRLTAEKLNSNDAAEQARQAKIARSTATDLSLDPKSRNGTVPVGSIDDTLRETMARLNGAA